MPIVSYSPYNDAANAGAGLSEGLTRLALQLPQLKMQQLQQEANFKRLPYELALSVAQQHLAEKRGGEADSRSNLYGAQAKGVEEQTAQRQGLAKLTGVPAAIGNNPEQMAAAMSMIRNILSGNFAKPVAIPNGGSLAIGTNAPMMEGAATVPAGSMRLPAVNSNVGQESVVAPNKPMAGDKQNPNGLIEKLLTLAANPMSGIDTASPDYTNLLSTAMSRATNGMQGAVAPAAKAGGPVTVNSQEEYDKLPNGASFIDSTGHTKIKGKK